MIDNVPIKRVEFGTVSVEGYSRAAVQTFWRIPELKLGFDLGAQPWDFMGTATWFVSHCHLDHIASLPQYVSRRRLMKMEPPTIYLPSHAIEPIKQVMHGFSRLDRGRMPCELIGVGPGDEIDLSRELTVTVCKTRHTVPSLGFIVWEKRKKLKAEYVGLSGDQIRDLRMSGKEVSDEKRFPLVGYTGDTSPQGLDDNPDMFRARILITEMTFVAPDHRKEKIHKTGHMHLDDIIERKDRFENEHVIVSHFSTRYNRKQIRKMIENRLPEMLDGRLILWI